MCRKSYVSRKAKATQVMKSGTLMLKAYMILKVAEVSAQPVDKVINVFKANRNKGWGYIAKQMGIKPGSAEFHALKGGSSGTKSKGKGKGKKRK